MTEAQARIGRAGVNVGYLLAQRARLNPDQTAVVDGATELDYARLNDEVNRLASGLAAEGIGAGDRVAILASNSYRFYELLFACAKLGAILVTVNYRLVADEVEYVMRDSGAALLFHSAEFADVAQTVARIVGDLRAGTLEGTQDGLSLQRLVENGTGEEPNRPVRLDAPLMILYTSGTTGHPKGAVLTHANLVATSTNQHFDWGVTAADRCLVAAPLYHVGALLLLSWPTLHAGGTVVVHPGFDPRAVLDAIEHDRVSTLFLAPTMWRMMLLEPDALTRDLSAIRLCCSGGESLPLPLMEQLIDVFGSQFTEGYGLTEASAAVAVLRPEHLRTKSGSVGMPFLHVAVRVVAPDGEDVPTGALGEIIVNGPTVMAEYWGRPEATADKLRDGWLHTGDVGRFDADGFLFIVDRMDDMLISGGENVYPAEVESVLHGHPDIDQVAVIGVADERWGQIVTAAVVPADGASPTIEDIAAFCGDRLAGFKRPRRLVLVDDLPRNPSGKVLKRVLRDDLQAGAPR
ncbi:MAG: fatty-acyl-CoA synthase [Solirubrobacteraceae bacterium]|jgi:fatty-acyl-CoA synthase|nr:fatty-acyl-CoA synthase [Solirubrobacteraceae bacterium]